MKIYVAGPYTPTIRDSHDVPRLAHRNVLRAIRAGIRIIEMGHIPFIPHLTHFIHLETKRPLPPEFYYEYDRTWLQYCDALLCLGDSKGVKKELQWAKKRKLKIFYSMQQIPNMRRIDT